MIKYILILLLLGQTESVQNINLMSSNITWRGTGMFGVQKREGKLYFSQGYLRFSGNKPISGHFLVDIDSLEPSDFPNSETIAKQNFTKHLKSDSFFHLKKHPYASLSIARISKTGLAHAKLTIKGITRNVQFQIKQEKNLYTANLALDRTKWGINYKGDRLKNTLVDDEIRLDIKVVL